MREVQSDKAYRAWLRLSRREQDALYRKQSAEAPGRAFTFWLADKINADLKRHVAATFKFPWSDPAPKDPAGIVSENTGCIAYATPEEPLVVWKLEPGNPPRFVRVQS